MQQTAPFRLSTGIAGLDEILDGGLIPERTYLVRGGPGAGKTMLGLHFLTAGAAIGEQTLFITLGEPVDQLRSNANFLDFNLLNIEFLDLSPSQDIFAEVQTYDIFSPAEVERKPTTQKIIEYIEKTKPKRVVFDSITQFRYLAIDTFQFRKQILSFIRFLSHHGATALFASENSDSAPDNDLQFMVDGVLNLDLLNDRRSIRVTKFRGSNFRTGSHTMSLTQTGMIVFPRLLPEAHRRVFTIEALPFGIPRLDELLHGGLERGTTTVITGPSGVGKTTVGLQFMKEAAGRCERSVVYTFEEEVDIVLRRCQQINIPALVMQERGVLTVAKVEPLRYTPDEFAALVRQEVEKRETQIVMLDSISGYQVSLRGDDLRSHLHALSKYLTNMGVTVILINELKTISGLVQATEVGITYLADNIILMRYMERHTLRHVELRRGISVLKKRLSDFEKSMREIEITSYGILIGQPIPGLNGILYSAPSWSDSKD
jgi:circadian clock protein KaiC